LLVGVVLEMGFGSGVSGRRETCSILGSIIERVVRLACRKMEMGVELIKKLVEFKVCRTLTLLDFYTSSSLGWQ